MSALTAGKPYLVSFTSGSIPSNAAALIASAGGSIAARYNAVGVVLARSASASFAPALRGLAGIDAVGAADAVHSGIGTVRGKASARRSHGSRPIPGNDPLSFRQWDMDQIRAPQARAINGGKKSVLVGLLDSGIDANHPDLRGQVDAGASVSCLGGVPNASPSAWADIIGHGTHMSGIIAGKKNGVGIVGVAPGVKLAAVKVAVDDVNDPNFGLVFPDAFVCGIDWAISHNFDLMNASLTIDPFTAPIDDIFCSDQPDRAAIVKMVRRAVLAAGRKNISLVAATGNFALDLGNLDETTGGTNCKVIPVQLPRVIGVSSIGVTKKLAFYSDYGFGAVDLTAPGGDGLVPDPAVTDTEASGQVLSSVPADSVYYAFAADWDGQIQDCSVTPCATYAYLQGTSMATPHVTGVAALLLSKYGTLSPEALLVKLSLSANPLACPPAPYDPAGFGPMNCQGPAFYNNFYGAGIVDALAAIR